MAVAREEELIRAALRRLLGKADGRLFGSANAAFLQRTAGAQRAADTLFTRGFIESNGIPDGCRLTPAGMQWLVEQDDPQLLLEDLLRASETQAEVLRQMEKQCRRQADEMEQQRAGVAALLARLPVGRGAEAAIEPEIAEVLAEHRLSGNPGDCSAAELYDRLLRRRPHLTIGQFHDALRALREIGGLRLAPWTGPLYQLPQPALALLIGHEVLYYVQLQPGARAA